MAKFGIAFVLLTVAGISHGTSVNPYKYCPKNEEYSECGNNGCQNTCANPNIAPVCKAACNPGCICVEGYLRNTKGVCVPYNECDTCKPNEIFDKCGNHGCVNTCSEPDLITRCTPPGCIPGCICRQGYLRNERNECVKPEECKICKGQNEYFKVCGDACPATCKNTTKSNCIGCAPDGCVCKPGYVRGWDNKCILPSECPTCPGPNEYYGCGSPCDRECATLGKPCTIPLKKGENCRLRCFCKVDFARDSKGKCIPIKECPQNQCNGDPNAISLPCGDPCPTTCENKDDPGPRPCPKICIKNGCKCKDGYVKGKDGKCILTKNCPPINNPPLKCRANEVFDKCMKDCPPEKTCESYMSGIEINCLRSDDCKPACKCKDGFLRNKEGRCVKPEECCTAKNTELVSCPNPCPGGTCDAPDFQPCKVKCFRYGCQCKPGYVKISDTNDSCILKQLCHTYD